MTEPCYEIIPARHTAERTFCVLGVPRGGTSMASGLLERMGVFMGSDLGPKTREDRAFLGHRGHRDLFQDTRREADKVQYLKGLDDLIARRNEDHLVWGWKDPISIFYLPEVATRLRNPHYIFVTRDLGAVAQHEMIFENGLYPARHILAHLLVASDALSKICAFLARQEQPSLMISYERSLAAPDRMISSLKSFVGSDIPVEQLASFVKPARDKPWSPAANSPLAR